MSSLHWELLDAATRGALSVLLILLAVLLGRQRRGLALAPVGIALALGLLVQVVSGAPAIDDALPHALLAPVVGISVANSLLFWLFARALFEDGYRARSWQALLWLAVVLVGGLACALCAPGQSLNGPRQGLLLLKNWLPLGFGLLVLATAARHWSADLVEQRRRLRLFVILAGALDTLMMVAARMAEPQGRVTGLMAWLDVALLLAITAVITAQALRVPESLLLCPPRARHDEPGPAPSTSEQAVARPVDQQLAAELRQAMEIERVYKDEALSMAKLASRLKVPEYRLRRAINLDLGHRNFNAYVNGYRLAEARAALISPAQRDLPVLTIALEAGFGSIGPFNRAFKAETGLTPTEFRKQKLAES